MFYPNSFVFRKLTSMHCMACDAAQAHNVPLPGRGFSASVAFDPLTSSLEIYSIVLRIHVPSGCSRGAVCRSRSMPESSRNAVRLGVRMTPPTAICVEYMLPGGPRISRRKLRTKVVRLHHPLASSSESCASRLAERFPRHFGEDVVNHTQLVRLISKIQRSVNESKSKTTFSAEETTTWCGGGQIHPEGAITTAAAADIKNKKVSLLNDHEAKLDGRNALSSGKTGCGVKVTETTTTSSSVLVKCARGPSLNCCQEDLNGVSESELSSAKQRMDVIFQRNSCRPGEAFYVHDVRKNFVGATEDCGWDDSSCSSRST